PMLTELSPCSLHVALPISQEQDKIIKQLVDSTTPTMPPRERSTLQRSFDFAVGRGNLACARATVYGVTPYITTGALQAAAVQKLDRKSTRLNSSHRTTSYA